MMRKKSLWAVLGCVALLGLAGGCSDDDSATCGNGVIEGGEECDLDQLGNATCADVVPGTTGTLSCNPTTCEYDTTGCTTGPECGNGIPEFGEPCDCGTDVTELPAGCTDVNGGANANCSATCERVDLCGDGVVTGNEECDCGDSSMVSDPSSGCDGFNGAAGSDCDSDCTSIYLCSHGLFEECSLSDGVAPTHLCCEDDYGVQLECKTSLFAGMDNFCARSCTAADECPWNSFCFGTVNPAYDLCYYSMCGPNDLVQADFFDVCQAPAGGTPGRCIPFGRYSDTKDFYGFCVEDGTIAPGDPCPTRNADPPVGLLDTDRDIPGGAAASQCDTGICLSTQGATEGQCAQFCDWETEYEAIFYGGTPGPLACPANSNCWAEATISLDDVSPYADYGYRGADLGYCRPLEAADSTYGMTTCSLVTGQLLSDPALTCADTNTDGRCLIVSYSVDYYDANGSVIGSADEPTMGQLIGVCSDADPVTITNVWDPCDPANDVCPMGSLCMEEDVFDAGTGTTRCIPMCDTQYHDGTTATCADLGTPATTADGTPVCTSVSYTFGAGGAADPSKSRLGFCALPMP